MTTQIQSTKNYDQFKLVEGNRRIIPHHLARLTVSILQDNMLAQNPIIVNEEMEVIDGQHRLEVARNNNLEIFYIVLPNATLSEVVRLNVNNRAWTSTDFVDSYAVRGNPDYIWLKEFIEQYAISLSVAIMFIFASNNNYSNRKVKSGDLKLSEKMKQRASQRADALWDIRPYFSRKGMLPRGFIYALIRQVDEGNGSRIARAITERGKLFNPEAEFKKAEAQLRSFLS